MDGPLKNNAKGFASGRGRELEAAARERLRVWYPGDRPGLLLGSTMRTRQPVECGEMLTSVEAVAPHRERYAGQGGWPSSTEVSREAGRSAVHHVTST
jgi:hypothetical protein